MIIESSNNFRTAKTFGNTAQFPPCGLSTAPAATARHLRCQKGCGTRIVLRGQKPLALCDRCPCFGSLFPPLAALTFAASSIICAFGLASAAPRSPYRHLKLCGIAYNKTKNPGTIFIPKSCRDLYYSMRSRLKFFAEAFFQKGWKGKLNINPCSFCWWPSCAGRGPGYACGCAGSPE